MEIKGKKDKESKEYVDELLKKYNLYDFKDKYPSELSGGMRQRAALIRTLAVKPKILLLDEVTTGLDENSKEIVHHLFDDVRKKHVTILQVTHDKSEIEKANKIFEVKKAFLDEKRSCQ